MEIIELLRSDHRTVEELLDRIESAEGDEQVRLVEELGTSLTAHMQLEEQYLYELVGEVLGEEESTEADIEHRLAREGLEKLEGLVPGEPGLGAALGMLRAGITHHVEDEEGEIFPQLARRARAQLQELQPAVRAAREQLGLPIDAQVSGTASIDLTDATRDELYERAKEAGIEGRSSMSKEELAQALGR